MKKQIFSGKGLERWYMSWYNFQRHMGWEWKWLFDKKHIIDHTKDKEEYANVCILICIFRRVFYMHLLKIYSLSLSLSHYIYIYIYVYIYIYMCVCVCVCEFKFRWYQTTKGTSTVCFFFKYGNIHTTHIIEEIPNKDNVILFIFNDELHYSLFTWYKKSWTRLKAHHILGKHVNPTILYLQLWGNCKADWAI